MLAIWLIVFVLALAVLVKGSDWLLEAAEKMGLAIGLSPFIVGVTLVGIGTSLPELTSSIFAIVQGVTDLPVANAVGSNITNILVVISVVVIASRRIVLKRSMIDQDLPLLALVTALFVIMAADGAINFGESLLLIAGYGFYLGYSVTNVDKEKLAAATHVLPHRLRKAHWWWPFGLTTELKRPKIHGTDIVRFAAGVVALPLGAHFIVVSAVELSSLLNIATGVIALLAIAFGTSLPEIAVSLRAASRGKPDLAVGNIIGSSAFNLLVVVGVSGALTPLTIDSTTLAVGIPILVVATLVLIISGITKHIHMWEGWMYLLIYGFFVGRVTNLL